MACDFSNVHSSFDNSNICQSLFYIEKDSFHYTDKNGIDSYNFKDYGRDENENDSYSFKFYQNEDHLDEKTDKNDENPDVFNFQSPLSVQKLSDKNIQIQEKNTKLGKTSATSQTLGKKRERPDGQKDKTPTKLSSDKVTTKKRSNCGRRAKGQKNREGHTQLSDDNVMRKIKSNFLKYSHNRINDSFIDKNLQFLKLDSEINENLKKDYNEKLMKTNFKELYETSEISSKYRKQKNINNTLNKMIIKKIYSEENEEKKEYKVIELLENNYLDLFKDFRNFYLNIFLDEIKATLIKDEESEEYIKIYLEKMKHLCMNYEDWFHKKNGRNREKKIKII